MLDSLLALKVFLPSLLTFLIGLAITPTLTNIFYKHRLWKKITRQDSASNPTVTSNFKKIHDQEREVSTPRVGGIVVWLSILITMTLIWLITLIFPNELTLQLDFVSRSQTLLPLAALLLGAFVGLVEDGLEIVGTNKSYFAHGIPRMHKAVVIIVLSLIVGLWFYIKLDTSWIWVPFYGELDLGWLFIPYFIAVVFGTFSSRVIDGVDGLSGGVLISIFSAYAIISFLNNQIDLAAFNAVVVGGILAFLWFNIPPARFYMGETGMLGLTLALGIIVFLTHTSLLLLVIGFPLVATSVSSGIQILSKKFRNGKTVFKVAPLHHHFQALGWQSYKVTMRYWVISVISAITGLIIYLIG